MSENIFQSKKIEFAAIIKDALAKGLPPLFRVHRKLLDKADPVSFELRYSIKDLAQALDYTPLELQTILKDLSILDFIEYEEGEEDGKIKIIVH